MTPAAIAANRHNGEKGGRPRKVRSFSDEELAELGELPADKPLRAIRWVQRALIMDFQRQLRGQADEILSRNLRATAATIQRLMPADVMAQVEEIIRDDKAEMQRGGAELDPTMEDAFDAADPSAQPLSCADRRERARQR